MKAVDAAWLAAAIDGEGTILLQTMKKNGVTTARLAVYNTDERFIAKAASLIGCNVYQILPRSSITSNPRLLFSAQSNNHETVLRALIEVLPFLLVKHARAKEVVAFIEGKSWGFTDKSRKKLSKSLRAQWKDPVIRERRISGMKGAKRKCA